jgi:DNA primase
MAAHQAVIEGCVAVLGTAMTATHARQLGRVAGDGRLILVFDGDAAGQASGVKSAAVCLQAGVAASVAVLPQGQDPAELLGSTPGETQALEQVLESARPEIEHFLRATAPRPYELDERGRLEALDKVLAILRPVADTDLRDAYLAQAASWFNLETRRLQQRMQQQAPEPRPVEDPTDYGAEDDGGVYGFEDAVPVRPLPRLTRDRESILMVLLQRPDLRPQAFDDGGLEPRFFPAPWSHLVAAMAERPDDDHHALALLETFVHFPGADRQVLRWAAPDARLSDGQDIEDPESVLAAGLGELRLKAIEYDLQRLQHELKLAQQSGDQARIGSLFKDVLAKQQERRRVQEGE